MPNWCYTTYYIEGDREEIFKFGEMLYELEKLSDSRIPNDFGNLFLGCLIDYLGGDWESTPCRGYIMEWERTHSGDIIIEVESAWQEPSETRKFLKEKFPGLNFWFRSEEKGNEYFVKNDVTGKYFNEKFIVECYDPETRVDESEYFEDIAEIPIYLKEKLGLECPADFDVIKLVFDQWRDENDDRLGFIAKFDIVD